MGRIKIENLPKNAKISKKEMKNVTGGISTYSTYVIAAPDGRAVRVHAAARAQKPLLDSVLAGVGEEIANGQVPM